jgi:DNA repair protein RecO (recombination protein O)
MLVSTKAIVLSAIKYSEADLIVCCFTQSNGLKSYLLPGILKSRKGKLRASYFQVLTQLELTARHRDKGTLERISEVKVLSPYTTLHTQVVKSTLLLFLSEILKNSIQEEQPNEALFQFLRDSLQWLDTHDRIANFHLLFLVQLTRYLGFYPDVKTIEGSFFNIYEGNFQNTGEGIYCATGGKVEAFKQLFGIDFERSDQIKLTKKVRSEILDMLLLYYRLHVQSFKQPKSLLVLNQLFN